MTKLADFTYQRLEENAAHVAGNAGTVWLDSSLRLGDRGNHSVLAHSPLMEITYNSGMMVQTGAGKSVLSPTTLAGAITEIECLLFENNWTAMGVISYEGMLEFLGLTSRHSADFPALHFFLYESIDVIEHTDPVKLHPEDHSPRVSHAAARLICGIDKHSYFAQVMEIKRRIFEGDIYQANLTHRFELQSSQDPFAVYQKLRALSPAPYGGFLNFGPYQIMSSSPERMLLRSGDQVTTGPIKGTIRRDDEVQRDVELTLELQESIKDRAEHLMIVDLERNDLGKIAQTGTVSVEALFRPEKYARLIHLVSDISARLKPDLPFHEICAALLPGGSITGAPKKAAVEILDAIEETPRGFYTGCIGYLTRERADFNIAIRTLIHKNGTYHVHAGGGIVADSDPQQEYLELLLKAHNQLRSLGVELSEIEA